MENLEKMVIGKKVLYVGKDYLILDGGWIVYADCACMSGYTWIGVKEPNESVPPDVEEVRKKLRRKGIIP